MFNFASVFSAFLYCLLQRKDSKLTLHHMGNFLLFNLTSYGEFFCYSICRDKILNLEGYIFEKFFTTKKLWDGLSGKNENIECALHLR